MLCFERNLPITDHILYAIGDVHGRADLLGDLLDWIEADAPAQGAQPCVRFLGDIIDRGPESRAAMDMVADTLDRWPGSRLMLGNHDDWLLQFLAGRPPEEDDWFELWMEQGGQETLSSYAASADRPRDARDIILDRHARHVQVLREASILECNGPFAFVHAGVDPAAGFDAQMRGTCLRIRSQFLQHVGLLDHVVIHGHSPQRPAQPTVTENRISMDTGAFFSGVLSVAAIAPGTVRFMAARERLGVSPIEATRFDRGLGTAIDRLAA
ncbi:MAG: metallophosphoesterase [Rhizobiaceae bacterium]|nr:metallophosphoesterase [Rhizobiaceae bacterium]